MRQLLSILVPLLLPTLAYFLYAFVLRRRAASGAAAAPPGDVPWTWLVVAGAVLVALTFAAYSLFGGAEPGATYHPPRVIDGRIEPGGFD